MRYFVFLSALFGLFPLTSPAQDARHEAGDRAAVTREQPTSRSSPKSQLSELQSSTAGVTSKLRVKLLFDDSKGMCGYLSEGSVFKSALAKLQRHVEVTEALTLSAHLLLGRDKQANKLAGESALRQLDQIANANNQRSCPFAAPTSPIANFMSIDDQDDVVMMFTDMVFDTGAQTNLAVERNKFIEKAVEWQSKASRGDARGVGAMLPGFGVVAIESQFTGSYFWANGSTEVKLESGKRPFFVLWRTSGTLRAGQFINTYLKQLAPSEAVKVHGTSKAPVTQSSSDAEASPLPRPVAASFTLLPYVSNDWQVRFDPVKYTSEYIAKGTGFSERAPFVTYDFANLQKVPSQELIVPEQCFAWRTGAILEFRNACASASSAVKNSFDAMRRLDLNGARLWIDLESAPGLSRKYIAATPGSDAVNLAFLTGCPKQDSNCTPNTWRRQHPALNSASAYAFREGEMKSFLAITVVPESPVVMKANFSPREIVWNESFFADATLATQLQSSRAQQWNAVREPCEPGAKASPEQCTEFAARTVGFDALLASLAGRLNPAKKLADTLNTCGGALNRCKVSFSVARNNNWPGDKK